MHNFREKHLYTYLATLGATSSIAEFDKVCTQFKEKPAVHFIPRQRRTLGAAFIGNRVRQGLYTILGKPHYTLIRLAKACLRVSTYCNSAHNSRKQNSHTLTKAGLHVFAYIVILYTILGKTSHTLT